MTCPRCGNRWCEVEWLGKPGHQQRLVWCQNCGVIDGLPDCRRPQPSGFAPLADGGGPTIAGWDAIAACRDALAACNPPERQTPRPPVGTPSVSDFDPDNTT